MLLLNSPRDTGSTSDLVATRYRSHHSRFSACFDLASSEPFWNKALLLASSQPISENSIGLWLVDSKLQGHQPDFRFGRNALLVSSQSTSCLPRSCFNQAFLEQSTATGFIAADFLEQHWPVAGRFKAPGTSAGIAIEAGRLVKQSGT